MGVGPDAAKGLTMWEYEAMLSEHEMRNDPDGKTVKAPSRAKVRDALDRLAADPRFTGQV